MSELLESGTVLMHPFVIGEIALGNLPQRAFTLAQLRKLPESNVASPSEVLQFIETHELDGSGIGYVDVHLLASAKLTDCRLLTRDKRLSRVATQLDLSAEGIH